MRQIVKPEHALAANRNIGTDMFCSSQEMGSRKCRSHTTVLNVLSKCKYLLYSYILFIILRDVSRVDFRGNVCFQIDKLCGKCRLNNNNNIYTGENALKQVRISKRFLRLTYDKAILTHHHSYLVPLKTI